MEINSLEDIKTTLSNIEDSSYDCEVAHGLEDELFESVLKFIAVHCSDDLCKLFAKEALKSKFIKFPRYRA